MKKFGFVAILVLLGGVFAACATGVRSTASGDFAWRIVLAPTGYYAIITGFSGTNSDIRIPSDIRGGDLMGLIFGVPVRTIAPGAFADRGLTSVRIPRGVTSIGDDAFANNKLTSVDINARNEVTIGNRAFANNELTSISLSSLARVGTGAFNGNDITSITVGDMVYLQRSFDTVAGLEFERLFWLTSHIDIVTGRATEVGFNRAPGTYIRRGNTWVRQQ